MRKSTGKTCTLCNQKVTGGLDGMKQHGHDYHPDHFMTKAGKFSEKKYFCPLDNTWHSNLKHLSRAVTRNGWINENYLMTYGEQYLPDIWYRINNHPKFGNAMCDPNCLQCGKPAPFDKNHWEYAVFCNFSCSTTWHAQNTNRVAIAMETLKQRKAEDPAHCLNPTQLDYWIIKKGMTEQEAIIARSERQTTFSLEICIEKYGEVEGRKRFNERTITWMKSCNESNPNMGKSKIAIELFDQIVKYFPTIKYGKNEVILTFKEHNPIEVDCMKEESKKVIEFFGDYWHGNPDLYSEDYKIRGKADDAQELWGLDKFRIENIINSSYEVLVIWEKDYKDSPKSVLLKCLRFLEDNDGPMKNMTILDSRLYQYD